MPEDRKVPTFKIRNFRYNGFYGEYLPGEAPYTAMFAEWTKDPGVAIFKCSDGQKRLIPTFALIGDRKGLPEQDFRSKVYFGTPCHS